MKRISALLLLIAVAAISLKIYIFLYSAPQDEPSLPVCTRLPRIDVPEFAPNSKRKWPDNTTVLYVYFAAGENDLTASIIETANEWSEYCRIHFEPTKEFPLAQIKVTFDKSGYASAVGTECIQEKYLTEFNMCLQGIDKVTSPEEFKRVVLHEFGHALGIEHELSKPSATIPWNKPEVYSYYKKKFKWGKSEVNHNIFEQLKPDSKENEEFDSTSVMVYGVKPPLTIAPYEIPWPKGLSKTDKEGINKWYPKKPKNKS